MGYYNGDWTTTALFFESGTYGSQSGAAIWPGLVQSAEPDENINLRPTRYVGGDTRNIDTFIKGPKDFNVSMSLFPQDFRLLGFALGSMVSAGSPTPYQHTLKESDKTTCLFPSLQAELAQQGCVAGSNFVRTATGMVVDSLTINSSEGEPVTFDANFIAQNITFSSGAVTSVTANTSRPFVWSDALVSIPSGTNVDNITSTTFSINNTFRAPHHLNGSEVIDTPIPQGREYSIDLNLESYDANTKTFYDQYYLGGSEFNMQMRYVASAGSRDAVLTFSGCRINKMTSPVTNENVQTQVINITPKSCSAVVDDIIEVYGV